MVGSVLLGRTHLRFFTRKRGWNKAMEMTQQGQIERFVFWPLRQGLLGARGEFVVVHGLMAHLLRLVGEILVAVPR